MMDIVPHQLTHIHRANERLGLNIEVLTYCKLYKKDIDIDIKYCWYTYSKNAHSTFLRSHLIDEGIYILLLVKQSLGLLSSCFLFLFSLTFNGGWEVMYRINTVTNATIDVTATPCRYISRIGNAGHSLYEAGARRPRYVMQ